MVNKMMIYDRLAIIDRAVARLEKFGDLSFDDFLQDSDNFAIAEHNLRIALEAVFDIGRHLIVKLNKGKPEDYRQILIMLSQIGVLPNEFAEKIKGMAGYRNRLVHLYNEIDDKEIYDIIKTKLNDIREFCSYIIKFINRLN